MCKAKSISKINSMRKPQSTRKLKSACKTGITGKTGMTCKIRVAIVSLLLLVLSPVVTVFAESPLLTREEAKSIIETAVDIRNSVGMYFQWYDGITVSPEHQVNIDYSKASSQRPKGYEFSDFIKVRKGYEPEQVKTLIRDVFTSDIADGLIDNNPGFWGLYYCENGSWYYEVYRSGCKYFYDSGDRTNTFFDPEDIEQLKIVANEGGKAAVEVPVNRVSKDGLRDKSKVTFHFTHDGRSWKICRLDAENMLFRAEKVDNKNLSKELVRETIVATVCDVYALTTLSTVKRYITYGGATFSARNSKLNLFEGSLSEPVVWQAYLEQYCTKEAADGFLRFGQELTFGQNVRNDNGRLFFFYPWSGFEAECDADNSYLIGDVMKDNVEILQNDGKNATVEYTFSHIPRREPLKVSLDYTFTEDGWKLSSSDFITSLDEAYRVRSFHPGTADRTNLFPAISAAMLSLGVIFGLSAVRGKAPKRAKRA